MNRIRILMTVLAFPLLFSDGFAGDLTIDQSGQSGQIDGRVIDESAGFTIDVSQVGTENNLEFVLESDLTANIVQEGNFGEINLDFRSESDNLSIDQYGSNNRIVGVFTGSTNTSSLLQNNTGNTLDVNISGRLNILEVEQTGESNLMTLELKGNEGNFKLTQTGNNNELDRACSALHGKNELSVGLFTVE